MQRLIRLAALSAFVVVTLPAAAAVTVELGPVYNPATGSRYYRIGGGDWNQLRAFAQALGGDLCTVNDAAENTWLRTNVVGSGSKPYIGLNDAGTEGTFAWADGSGSTYRNWRAGEPSNTATKDYVRFDGTTQGTWEVVTVNFGPQAIVEINGPMRVPEEYPTIAAAFNAIGQVGTREILVAPGTYRLTDPVAGSDFTLRGSGIGVTTIEGLTSTSIDSLFAYGTCLIENLSFQGRSTSRSVVLTSGEDTRFRNCEFYSLLGTDSDSLLFINGPSVTVENSVFRDAEFAFQVQTGGAPARVNFLNTVLRNMAFVGFSQTNTTFTFTNCLFTRMTQNNFFSGGPFVLKNCIVAGNPGTFGPAGALTVSYSLLPTALPGAGNLVATPQFVNAVGNDFRLAAGSPGIDAGSLAAFLTAGPTTLTDAGGSNRLSDAATVPNSGEGTQPIDMGPFEFQAPPCSADLDGNGIVDDTDFVLFAIQYNAFVCP